MVKNNQADIQRKKLLHLKMSTVQIAKGNLLSKKKILYGFNISVSKVIKARVERSK